MLVVLDDGSGPVTCTARPWDRALARLRAGRLDYALAAGASPDATVGLALRAQVLIGGRVRREIAQSAQRILQTADGRRLRVPVCRDRIRDCSAEINELISRLLAPGPVSAQGVALAMALVGDGAGPLYQKASSVDLRSTVRCVVDALSAP